MHRIELRTEGDLDWRDIVKQVIKRPLDAQKGADIEEIRRGVFILDVLDKANGSLELENREWEHLCSKIKAMPWAYVDRRILWFCDDVLTAPEL